MSFVYILCRGTWRKEKTFKLIWLMLYGSEWSMYGGSEQDYTGATCRLFVLPSWDLRSSLYVWEDLGWGFWCGGTGFKNSNLGVLFKLFFHKNNETAFYFKVWMLHKIPIIFLKVGIIWPFCYEHSVALLLDLIHTEQEGKVLGNEKWGKSSLISFVDAISFVLIYFWFKHEKVFFWGITENVVKAS